MKIKKVKLPNTSLISNMNYDYIDCYSAPIENIQNLQSDEVGKAFFLSSPKWVHNLLILRNKIVSLFGLKTISPNSQEEIFINEIHFKKGKQLGLFKIYDINNQELILGEDDKHLNFKVSFFIDSEFHSQQKLIISTLVAYNNIWGTLYFLLVKPFHKVIVKSMLKKTIQTITANSLQSTSSGQVSEN